MTDGFIDTEILRESVRSRAVQTLPGAIAVSLALVLLPILLLGQVSFWRMGIWFGSVALAMSGRILLARHILSRLDSADATFIEAADRRLRYSSMLNQTVSGAGIWLAGAGATEAVQFFLTLSIALFGVGAMVNLSSDYRSFRASLPLQMVHPVCFWLLAGLDGLRIALPLAALSLLMLSQVRGSTRMFADSVRMRFEKNALLDRVEHERAATADALQMAHSAMRTRSMFLAAASHDLRQPLYAITLLGDALAAEPLPEHAATVVTRQRHAISVLRGQFDNMLDLSRFEAGEVRASLRDVWLRDVLGPLASDYEIVCRSKGIGWHAELPDACVHTDPELVRRLAGNLLSNAVRYTLSGGVRLEVAVASGSVTVTVVDTGVGIPAAEVERVFEEYVQLANPARDRDKGVGIGLSIVRRIGELLDAQVRLESAEGAGTRVSFRLPIAADGARVSTPAPLPGAVSAPDLRGSRVWIVEDDPLVRDALASQLSAWGVAHGFALDRQGLEALRAADGGRWPDAVMLDDMLGRDESGLELARWLAARMQRERIVLVTGNVDPQRTVELEQSGFVTLLKPLAAQDLAEFLADAVAAEGAH
jgi:signal transduction histidine kinase/CheY-like chemotaxis protein